MKARVVRSHQREFDCKILESSKLVNATALGNLLKGDDNIVVGDFVEIKFDEANDSYVIHEVYERTSEIYRVLVRESKRKVTASNLDVIVILSSVSRPKFKQGIVDRFLVRAHQWGIYPIVVFNKMDEYKSDSFDIEFEKKRLEFLNIPCFEISAINPDYAPKYLENGIDQLREFLKNKLSIFLGQSGVGKSQTISTLSQGRASLATKKVGRKSGKGSHTTTWSEIVDCGDFEVVDSPGIRQFSLEDLESRDFIEFWPDLEQIAVHCEFNDCLHEENSKGCAFQNSDFITPENEPYIFSRLDSYKRILDEISQVPDWKK